MVSPTTARGAAVDKDGDAPTSAFQSLRGLFSGAPAGCKGRQRAALQEPLCMCLPLSMCRYVYIYIYMYSCVLLGIRLTYKDAESAGCIHLDTSTCLYNCKIMRVDAGVYVCMYVWMNECMYSGKMNVCMYAFMYLCLRTFVFSFCIYVCYV